MGEQKTAFTLLLIFCLVLGYFPKISAVKAEDNIIYVRADESIEGTDKIQREGNVYTFTSNISGSIVIERDNIVVDGAGYTLQGTGNWTIVSPPYVIPPLYDYQGPENETEVSLTGRTNVTIMNLQLTYFHNPINLERSSYNILSGNTIIHSYRTIEITDKSSNNKIIGNRIENNSGGIILLESSDNSISDNIIRSNLGGGVIIGGDVAQSLNNLISNNYIAYQNSDGIRLGYGSSSTIINGNTIISNNPNGIYVMSGSTIILNNHITNHRRAILLDSPDNLIAGNTINGNTRAGIEFFSGNNSIYHNNFIANVRQVRVSDHTNVWDNGTTGNYWSDYTGRDENGDGVGDSAYTILFFNEDLYPLNSSTQERYPLMQPVTSPEPYNEEPEPMSFPTEWILTIIGITAIVGVVIMFYFFQFKKTKS